MNSIRKKYVQLAVASILLLSIAFAALSPVLSVQAQAKTDPRAFQDAMRKLWEDHITWTRLVILGTFEDLPDLAPSTQRLLQNQEDLGNTIKPFYGEEAGEQATHCPAHTYSNCRRNTPGCQK